MRRPFLTRRSSTAALALVLTSCGSGLPFVGNADGAPVGVQAPSLGGVVLDVLSVRSSGDRSLVKVRVMNGYSSDISLDPARLNTYLLTDAGEKLMLIEPATNPDLSVPAGKTMDGDLVFEGALPTSGRATLVINQQGRLDRESTSSPKFEVALPLDGSRGGATIAETSSLSGMRPNPSSRLQLASATASSLGTAGEATSSFQAVETLKTELGAVETDRGTVVSLAGDVTFDFDQATIREDARATLDRLAQLIGATGGGAISIEGHTDAKGDDDYNKRLSQARAETVKTYLTEKGVSAERLGTIGLGELRPVAPNAKANGTDDEDGRRRNRRVEVILPGKQDLVAREGAGADRR